MIPKTIHYIWFGGNELPDDAMNCIESWREHCPDFSICRWDETNFDITSNRYVKEAYESKKWAFVSDYVRLWVLVKHGGIYMDTDVEVLKPLDFVLSNKGFSGFESNSSVPTGIMGCEKGFPLFAEMLEDYNDRTFIKPDGSFDETTNVVTITNILKNKGLKLNNQFQIVSDFTLYPSDWFCPKSHDTGIVNLTENTYTIHHFKGSWLDRSEQEIRASKEKMLKKHPWVPSLFAGLCIRIRYGIQHKDFEPLKKMMLFTIKGKH